MMMMQGNWEEIGLFLRCVEHLTIGSTDFFPSHYRSVYSNDNSDMVVHMRRVMVTPRCWCKVCPRCFQPFLVKKCHPTRERITNKLQCNRSKTNKNSLPCLLILAINVILEAFLFTNTSQLTCSLSWQEKKKYAHSHSLTRSTNKLRKGASQNVYYKAWQQSKLRLPFFDQLLVKVGKEVSAIHGHIMYT